MQIFWGGSGRDENKIQEGITLEVEEIKDVGWVNIQIPKNDNWSGKEKKISELHGKDDNEWGELLCIFTQNVKGGEIRYILMNIPCLSRNCRLMTYFLGMN